MRSTGALAGSRTGAVLGAWKSSSLSRLRDVRPGLLFALIASTTCGFLSVPAWACASPRKHRLVFRDGLLTTLLLGPAEGCLPCPYFAPRSRSRVAQNKVWQVCAIALVDRPPARHTGGRGATTLFCQQALSIGSTQEQEANGRVKGD